MKEEHKKTYIFFRAILGWMFKLWYNPKIIGCENIPKDGPIIICGNHCHLMDQCSIIVSTKRMIHYFAKKEYFSGLFAWFFKSTGCISVDRSKKDSTSTNHGLLLLKNGYAVGIFPEGTRNRTDKVILPFKFGAVSMASKTDASIVPFGISGTYKFRSKDLVIKIGEPFKIGDLPLEKANQMLQDRILKLMN